MIIKNRIIIILVFFVILLLFLIFNYSFSVRSDLSDANLQKIIINENIIYVEIPETQEERLKGLGGRDELGQDYGMMFSFSQNKRPGFVMRDMKFPLDIIWINDNQVVDITKNIPVVTENQSLITYYPQKDVNLVVEVNSGYCESHDINVGDKVAFD